MTVAAEMLRAPGAAVTPFCDSVSGSPENPRNLTAHAEVIPGAVSSFPVDPGPCGVDFDPEFERLVSALEIELGWRSPPASAKYDATSASLAESRKFSIDVAADIASAEVTNSTSAGA